MYVIEITPHPEPGSDYSAMWLRFPAQIDNVAHFIDSMLDEFAHDEDAQGPENWKVTVEIKDVPLDEIVSTMESLDEPWRKAIEAAIARGEQCSDWPVDS